MIQTSEFYTNKKIDYPTVHLFSILIRFFKEYDSKIKYENDRKRIYEITKIFIRGGNDDDGNWVQGLHERLSITGLQSESLTGITGLGFLPVFEEFGMSWSTAHNMPSFQIQNLRKVSRVGPDGNQINHIVFSIIQRCGVVIRNRKIVDKYIPGDDEIPEGGMEFRGGCTLIFDLEKNKLRYSISKPLLDMDKIKYEKDADKKFVLNERRILEQYDYQFDEGLESRNEYSKYLGVNMNNIQEPFALLHSHKTENNGQ